MRYYKQWVLGYNLENWFIKRKLERPFKANEHTFVLTSVHTKQADLYIRTQRLIIVSQHNFYFSCANLYHLTKVRNLSGFSMIVSLVSGRDNCLLIPGPILFLIYFADPGFPGEVTNTHHLCSQGGQPSSVFVNWDLGVFSTSIYWSLSSLLLKERKRCQL